MFSNVNFNVWNKSVTKNLVYDILPSKNSGIFRFQIAVRMKPLHNFLRNGVIEKKKKIVCVGLKSCSGVSRTLSVRGKEQSFKNFLWPFFLLLLLFEFCFKKKICYDLFFFLLPTTTFLFFASHFQKSQLWFPDLNNICRLGWPQVPPLRKHRLSSRK